MLAVPINLPRCVQPIILCKLLVFDNSLNHKVLPVYVSNTLIIECCGGPPTIGHHLEQEIYPLLICQQEPPAQLFRLTPPDYLHLFLLFYTLTSVAGIYQKNIELSIWTHDRVKHWLKQIVLIPYDSILVMDLRTYCKVMDWGGMWF